MSPRTFDTVVAQASDGRVYLPLPFDPDAVWGARPRHHLGGRLGMHNFRGVVEAFDGFPGVVIGPAWRRDCGLEAGDAVTATLTPEGPQRADLAPDIAAALEADPAAAAFFDALAQFYRKAYLRWIEATSRRPDLRAERLAEMVTLLKDGRKERPRG